MVRGADGTVAGIIDPATGLVYASDMRYIGPLCPSFEVAKSLGFLHTVIDANKEKYDCRVESDKLVTLTAPNTRVSVHNLDDTQTTSSFAKVNVSGHKEALINSRSKMVTLQRLLNNATGDAIKAMFGLVFTVINNGVINIKQPAAAEQVRADDELAAAWFEVFNVACEEDRGMYRLVKTAEDAYYYFDLKTNLWTREKNTDHVSNHLLKAMKTELTFRHLTTPRGNTSDP